MGSRDYIRIRHTMATGTVKKSQKVEADLMQTDQGRLAKSCLLNAENTVITAANEPSLALYRITEHVRKSVVQLVGTKESAKTTNGRLTGAIYDTDYAITAATSVTKSLPTFKSINADLKTAIHLSQQIAHEHQRRSSHHRSKHS